MQGDTPFPSRRRPRVALAILADTSPCIYKKHFIFCQSLHISEKNIIFAKSFFGRCACQRLEAEMVK